MKIYQYIIFVPVSTAFPVIVDKIFLFKWLPSPLLYCVPSLFCHYQTLLPLLLLISKIRQAYKRTKW